MAFPGKDLILSTAELVDAVLGGLFDDQNGSDVEAGSLTIFLFHRFFLDDELTAPLGVFPHERVTVSNFDDFIRALKNRDFCFVLPRDVLAGRHVGRRAVMITVDDGYADNVRAIPVLDKHDAKAVFFICPANIAENKRFWPDALCIGAKRHGWSPRRIRRRQRELTMKPSDEAERLIKHWFGDDAFVPSGTLDRPLCVDELKAMASSPRVELGCHGYDHTVLAPRTDGFVLDQLRRSHSFFAQVIGYQPKAISYPNGAYSDDLVRICQTVGFRLGITIEARGNRLDMRAPPETMLALGRFTFSGARRIDRQIDSTQIRWSAMRSLYGLKTTKIVAAAGPESLPRPSPSAGGFERI